MVTDATQRLLLRAEVTIGQQTILTHTLEISTSRLTIVCPVNAARGSQVAVALSFPGLVERVELGCRVLEMHAPDGHGRPSSMTLEIVDASPDARARLAAIGAARAAREGEGPYKCLVVEDNGFIRDLFTYGMNKYAAVRKKSVTVELAEDAEKAWSLLEGSDYNMAIIDHYLPAQSGAELIARIRRDPRLAELPVVAISVGGSEVREATMAAGADLFLDKPIVLRDLFDTLDKLATQVHR